MANGDESQERCLQRLSQSLQRNQAWSGRRESNPRSQLGKQGTESSSRGLFPGQRPLDWNRKPPPQSLGMAWALLSRCTWARGVATLAKATRWRRDSAAGPRALDRAG